MINFGNISIADLRLGATQVKAAYLGSEQIWGGEEPGPVSDWLCFTAEQANSTVRLDKNGSPNAISLETSTDGSTWTDYSWSGNTGDTLTLANVGDKVYMRAKTENPTIGSSDSNYYQFKMTGRIAASGNIQTLLKSSGDVYAAPRYCYRNIFKGCTSLTTAPKLLATTLGDHCYMDAFNGCTALTATPEFPATTLGTYCYQGTFSGCTSLTKVEALPATTLATYCYCWMFGNCTSLTTAPELPATTVPTGCYENMFNGCRSLSSIVVAFSTWPDVTTNWLKNVAASGTFTCPVELPDIRDDSHIPVGWQVVKPAAPLCFTATSGNGYIKLGKTGSPDDISLEVSRDNIVWNDYTIGNGICINSSNDNKLYFRAKGQNQTISKDFGNYYYFRVYASTVGFAFEASGNIQTLLKADGSRLDAPAYCYSSMFSNCISLTTAPSLPATTLANYCYSSMFSGCSSLTTAPSLPATTLANYCYGSMFYGCSSLTTAPELPAMTLAKGCYGSMFSSCSSLTTAPALPATTLAKGCYGSMFSGCSSLTTAPALPATTLADSCYSSMFSNCTSLTTAPALPATTLAERCYESMFRDCTSLTTAPALPATTLANWCYSYMFYNCISLTTAPSLPATTLANYCYSSMFSNCTSLTTAPSLPATTLASGCYNSMFSGCSSLTTAPSLPATTLADYCYWSMFSGCSSLSSVEVAITSWNRYGAIVSQNWLQNVAASGTFTCPAELPDIRDDSHIPSGWTKVDAA